MLDMSNNVGSSVGTLFCPLCFGFLLQKGPCKVIYMFLVLSGYIWSKTILNLLLWTTFFSICGSCENYHCLCEFHFDHAEVREATECMNKQKWRGCLG